MTRNKIDMFSTANDTTKWVLAIDGYIQLFDTEAEAEAALNPVNQYDHWDDSGFGSMQIIPPGYVPYNYIHKCEMTTCLVSSVTPVNVVDYIAKSSDRLDKRIALAEIDKHATTPAYQRLARQRELATLWD